MGLLAGLVLLACAPVAGAQDAAHTAGSALPPSPTALVSPPTLTKPPAGHRLSARRVIAIARHVSNVAAILPHHHGVHASAFLKGANDWQVSWYDSRGAEIAQVLITDATGRVREAWTGFQVPWTMARGYPGAFGRRTAALYVWLPLCLLFMLPFVRWPPRLLHLDLLALLGLSVSLAFFSNGKIGLSVPLAYPPLLYLMGRALWIGFKPARERAPPALLVPVSWLGVAIVFLLGFRIGLNITNSNVIDVGYAGVIGADKLLHGHALYGAFPMDNARGDTYGPVAYLAYLPFRLLFGWSGRWDDLPAAHAAAVFFDVASAGGLYLLGRRLRDHALGIVLAYAWLAFPFTLFAANTNSNDALVALLVIVTLLVLGRPLARGAAGALAGLTKFAPLALGPLLARGTDDRLRIRPALLTVAGFLVAGALAMIPAISGAGLHTFYDHTIAYQADRGSPFSIWGLWHVPGVWQHCAQGAAVLLALAVAFVPGRRTQVQVAALAAAVLIALELGLTHWFYLYIVWFLPPLLIALLARSGSSTARPAPAPAAARSTRPA